MKKYIKDKWYDTEIEISICIHSSELQVSDEHWNEEALYQNSDGEFFLRTEACQEANNYIVLLSEGEAKDYVAHYGTVDDYEIMFGSVED